VHELEHDGLSIARNRKELIITCLLIWMSPTQSLDVKEKSISAGTLHFLSAERVFCFFS